jgi:hypothetical protein
MGHAREEKDHALRAQAAQSSWGVASNGRILDEPRLRAMEEMYLPD